MKTTLELKAFRSALIVMALGVGLLFYFEIWAGFVGLAIYMYLVYRLNRIMAQFNDESVLMVEHITRDFDSVTKQAIFSMPFPMCITDGKGVIIWYNSHLLTIFEDFDLMGMDIEKLIEGLDMEAILANRTVLPRIKMGSRDYDVHLSVVDTTKTQSARDKMVLFYFVDQTELVNLEVRYRDEFPIVAKIEVDNFDDAMDTAPSANRPQLEVEIDALIRSYFQTYDALVRKYESDMYLVVMSYNSLKQIKEKRFDLLDDLRELDMGNTIPITLSIGVASFGLTFKDAVAEADTCLDLALGRGGDQAVVRVEDNYEFFGGKSKAVEKRNKVKARVLGIALRQLIEGARDVYIMGHKNADMDAIGSAIGVLRATLNCDTEGYIVLNRPNPSISNLLDRMREDEPEMFKRIIKEETALANMTGRSLVILVDNHKPSFTEAPKLLEEQAQVVVIDHHRRGKEFVNNPVLTYVEPYASSTSELVTEMLTYMKDDLNLTHFEADALMSGIVVDTKNFSFQTGVRTFEAASILKRAGANMMKVKSLFQDDLDTLRTRADVVHQAQLVYDKVAVSRLSIAADNSILIAAQAADELLDINGVEASFVLTPVEEEVHISGRSVGDFSVQLILEKLGGGGHLNMAGARVAGTVDEAQDKLMQAIEAYLGEEEE
ncbi:DHH family phosphoesterase [Peptoniphilus equinus]|uniref:Cyclic-di-AMP phosphodiesterase n=1 Tax=Peptoniphilus equinus TaxID=3016343 RepID=A0ABY7QSU8_9FIRM|nr:DHH family phosphoesterase [Peptoniphilus equinus]WBW49865.1 DHH family phosphoesterase [Peptoniphilus equinus]